MSDKNKNAETVLEESKNLDSNRGERKEQLESPWKVTWRRLKKNRLSIIGLVMIVVIILLCIFGPTLFKLIKGYDFEDNFVGLKYESPNLNFWFGTDNLGRDVFLRTLKGGQISLFVGISAVAVEVILGTLFGLIAGYYGGLVDNIIMRVVDVFMSIPSLPLLLILAAVLSDMNFPPQYRMFVVMFILGFLSWPGLCRMIRGQVLTIREQEYMQAAEALGIRDSKKMFRHIFPNVIPLIIVNATLGLGGMILQESALSYLGLGVVPPTPTWGNLIQTVNDFYNLKNRPWLWIPPGIFIFLTVMAINLFGDGLRDALDPKLKK